MLKNNLLLLITLVVCSTFNSSRAQEYLISYDTLVSYQASLLEGLIPGFIGEVLEDFPLSQDSVLNAIDARYNIDMFKVLYNCEHPVHGLIQASAAVALPRDVECAMPLAVYLHGTTFNTEGVPSYQSTEHFLGAIFSVSGYVTLMPDYLGLGDSEYMHPYSHAQSTANSGRDLIRAVREMQEDLGFELNDEIVITGYSQGGHGAMALFKSLEEDHKEEFTVTACSPLSGAYSISDAQESVMWRPYDYQRYLPYVIEGYRSVYPELAEQFGAIYKDEYGDLNNFSGNTKQFFDIINQYDLPDIPIEILKDSLIIDYIQNKDHLLKVLMRENNNYDWTPEAPMLVQGCCDDEQVTIENSRLCYDTMVENGVQNLSFVDYCNEYPDIPFLGHGECVPFCLVAGKAFFDAHTTRCGITPVEETAIEKAIGLQIYPNPVVAGFTTLQSTEFINKNVDLTLYNAQGQLITTYTVSQFSGSIQIDLSAYQNGFYSFVMRADKKAYGVPFFIQQ